MPQLVIPISQHGPLIDISIGVSKQREEALKAAGQTVPARILIQALLDTGASCTHIDASVLASLQITRTSTTKIHTGSTTTTPHSCDVYDVSLIISDSTQSKIFDAIAVTEISLRAQGQPFAALVGRDVLSSGFLFYNGRQNQVTLMI